MSTTDTVLLIVLTSLLSLFTLIGIIILVYVLRLIAAVRKVVTKAENIVDSVESAADVLSDTKGRLALFKLIKNIIQLTQKRSK